MSDLFLLIKGVKISNDFRPDVLGFTISTLDSALSKNCLDISGPKIMSSEWISIKCLSIPYSMYSSGSDPPVIDLKLNAEIIPAQDIASQETSNRFAIS